MIDRVCISINNLCNLECKYCHFREKSAPTVTQTMNVLVILDNIREYIQKNDVPVFKIGFVGNGEPLLDFDNLKKYILHISDLLDSGRIRAYTITNGTVVDKDMLLFFKDHNVNVGFSLDGPKPIHDKYRCNSFELVMDSIELYFSIHNQYPSLNCTVGPDSIKDPMKVISFFEQFNSRITFSRMIGKYGISLETFRDFLKLASDRLNVRTGGYDCTMYGGLCGAGINNFYFSNQRVYLCGNCIDLKSLPYDIPIEQIRFSVGQIDRQYCYKESTYK